MNLISSSKRLICIQTKITFNRFACNPEGSILQSNLTLSRCSFIPYQFHSICIVVSDFKNEDIAHTTYQFAAMLKANLATSCFVLMSCNAKKGAHCVLLYT